MTTRREVLLLPGLLLLSRCGSSPPPPPALNLLIAAGADQNPNATGRPAPVAVRLYYMGATAKFERADIFALTEREKATLGDDSIGSEEFVVTPGEMRTIDRTPKAGVQFLGVTVLFRDIDNARWRAQAPVAASGPTALRLDIKGITATLSPAKPAKS